MRILSGIQPSGVLHIGNYFGMMRPALQLQDEGEAFYFIADYHALTSLRDPNLLRENVRRVALDFLACGLDPKRTALFLQTDVPQVTELTWILSTVTPVSRLELAHSYKDKVARGMAANAGLFTYPVLMAADILIYDGDVVPVGKDQKQHIEITRDIATRMNETYGDVFKLPEGRTQAKTARGNSARQIIHRQHSRRGREASQCNRRSGDGAGAKSSRPELKINHRTFAYRATASAAGTPEPVRTDTIYDFGGSGAVTSNTN